ncbi:LOW QUALITY PROTEIN: protein OBERON 4 [Salvia miltiorrhiza]|uniref:LOW QUALITY PROTEIN: protein OBERON 4 n=1 Tax=Salvia miltiorrhiza TaxID=226208 RepID=UPI0025AB6B03|nr:LOW QUALITY PROTEIN: protein OBERON 4 [Salvia miltiorrhiza]
MKRLRSSDDLHSYGEKGVLKDWGRREDEAAPQRSSSSLHRSSYYRSSDSGRKVLSSSTSRYDRLEDERESSKLIRKRPDYDLENYDRRKSYDRHKDGNGNGNGNDRGILSSSPRAGYGMDQMYRSQSFSAPRRDFPKGFRSERDRPKREGIGASWRRFGSGKDADDGARSGSEASRGTRVESKEVGKAKSPQGFRDAKSPAWSKDSGSERSRSVECKKSEEMQVESGGPSSEREEGELEPDPQPDVPAVKPVIEDKAAIDRPQPEKQLHNETRVENKVSLDKVSFSSVEKGNMSKVDSCEDQAEDGQSKEAEDVVSQNGDLPDCRDTSFRGAGGNRDDNDAKGENGGGDHVRDDGREGCLEEVADSTCDEKLSTLQEQQEDRIVNNQVKADDVEVAGSVQETCKSELPTTERTAPSMKDKGKCVALLPSDGILFTENLEVDNKPRDLTESRDTEMEGPSTRGFQFFSTDPIKKPEKVEQSTHSKPKDDKLALELSLSLPNVLLPIGSQRQAPGSPSHARSVQSFASSFRTNSDGFTASMSFSGSQQFTHNPSCSLTHNALDYEKSVGSKPLFQGVDWKALSLDETKNKEGSTYQGMSSRENVLHQQSQVSQGNSSGQAALQNMRVTGGSSKMLIGLERQLSSKQLSGAQGFGPYENGLEYSKDSRQSLTEKDSGSLQRNNGRDGKDQELGVGSDLAESIVTMIVSEPIHTMARRFNDMNAKHVPSIKEFARDIISNPGKQWQLSALQKALQKRSDITLDMLLNANRTQLEILVALKTGLREFVLQKDDIASSDLAEIFLNMRCRNLNCRSLLPVDECDCKICSQRSDFCRDCMCLVCSKFDMASNTCSWVGCDVCLHWCHADCGLRESHIRNGRSASGAQGTTEMQFYCVACDHPSEMFGFVKEVFQNFVKEWTPENLSRELEYVRRIFYASEDVRGKQLHEIAVRMLSRLANRSDFQEAQNYIINFFTETNLERSGNVIESRKELPARKQEGSNGIAGSSHGAGWMKPVYPEKAPLLGDPVNLIHDYSTNKNDKYTVNMDIPKITQKEPIIDELESIVRIKHAEAKMFQARAEDARKESEALKRISVTKSERIEEEYTSRITKLRLAEAEEMRKQKVEELQALERAYQEYFNMKMRMETDIKDLLLKMEATRRNLTT